VVILNIDDYNMKLLTQMLTQIRNAQRAGKLNVLIPYSKFNYNVAQVLSAAGFLGAVAKKGKSPKFYLETVLKYDKNGLAVISTPKGILSDWEARKRKLGGEVICEVW